MTLQDDESIAGTQPAITSAISSPSPTVSAEGTDGRCDESNGARSTECPAANGCDEGGGTGVVPSKPKASQKPLKPGATVQVRLRLPADFAAEFLAMPRHLRSSAACLALSTRVGKAFMLPELVASADQVRRVGVLLNQALRHAGADAELAHLVPAVKDTIAVIGKLRTKHKKGETS